MVLLQLKITLQTNVCAKAGGVTEDAPSHMCREITVKAAGPVCVREWVCLAGPLRVLWRAIYQSAKGCSCAQSMQRDGWHLSSKLSTPLEGRIFNLLSTAAMGTGSEGNN